VAHRWAAGSLLERDRPRSTEEEIPAQRLHQDHVPTRRRRIERDSASCLSLSPGRSNENRSYLLVAESDRLPLDDNQISSSRMHRQRAPVKRLSSPALNPGRDITVALAIVILSASLLVLSARSQVSDCYQGDYELPQGKRSTTPRN
jgi:hypothetical protein